MVFVHLLNHELYFFLGSLVEVSSGSFYRGCRVHVGSVRVLTLYSPHCLEYQTPRVVNVYWNVLQSQFVLWRSLLVKWGGGHRQQGDHTQTVYIYILDRPGLSY